MSIDDTPKKSKKKTDQNRDDVEFFDNISENTFLLSEVDSVFEDKEENTISLEEIYNKAKIYDSKPIFDSICYNCGQLLFGKTNKGCKQLAIPSVTEGEVTIIKMFRKNPVPLKMYTNQTLGRGYGRYFSCPKCKNGPANSVKNQFNVGSPETNCSDIPDSLIRICDFRDRQLISLCNIESYLNRPSNTVRKLMARQTGITNVINKSTIELTGMLGSIIYKNRPVGALMAEDPRAYIPENVITGIQWLSENNILYKKLLHKSSVNNPFKHHNSIPVNKDIVMPAHENVGMLIVADPENDLNSVPVINAHEHSIGECIEIIKENVREIGTVELLHKDVEAMMWPILFPYGNGGFKKTKGLEIPRYGQLRLLNYDSRWRDNKEYSFFLYDRIVRNCLTYRPNLILMNKSDYVNLTCAEGKSTHES